MRQEWADKLKNSQKFLLTLIYCPCHAGVRGNDTADRLEVRTAAIDGLGIDKEDIIKAYLKKKTLTSNAAYTTNVCLMVE